MRAFIILFILALSATTVWYLTRTVKSAPQIALEGAALSGGASMALSNIRLTEKKDNKTKVELVAKKASMRVDGKTADLKDFTMVSFISKKRRVVISGEKGVVDTETFEVSATGNIIVRDEKGNSLITDSLKLDNENRVVTTKGPVRIFGKNFLIAGDDMTIFLDEEKMELHSNVRAVFGQGS